MSCESLLYKSNIILVLLDHVQVITSMWHLLTYTCGIIPFIVFPRVGFLG